ncbi:MAG: type I restriction-modification enzyme R subunit C-terminal domain-containing protein [Methanothrix sp.]
MTPEEAARQKIDELLTQAGWKIQDFHDLNLGAALGVAVREFPLRSGFADYLLFIDREAVGAIEAKPEGTTLSGVEEQTGGYLSGLAEEIPHISNPLPFGYESTGTETFFVDLRDPNPRSRRVFAFHKPQTLKGWLNQGETLRARLKELPALAAGNLRDCQSEAITNLERSFAAAKQRSLIQMATGSGKTFAAVSFIYRLIKFGNARRVLFLVDRRTLGEQALTEFKQYITPDDGRKFTELYNVQHLTSNTLDPVCRVCITTIQRLYSMLRGEADLDTEIEEQSLFDVTPIEGQPLEIVYNPEIPVETFDFVITDECHRSIYNLWRQVLEYFDAFLVGMTATPSKQTLGFFNQNLVMEYNHERAVADGVNVGYEVYRIKTEISERGSKVEAGYYIDIRDKLTREKRWEMLDEDLEYSPRQLDRNVVATDQIRTVIRTFKEKLPEIFPERAVVPKTLIFAKDDSHAEDIVRIVREEFGKGNDFCKKITYRTQEKSSTLISNFRNSPNPRIAVTVDMISTGTDIKPLECLIFMRDVKSQVYFEQMKGRGTRTISPTDLESVTPGARYKTHFVIVDAVGVCERDKTDTRPLEQKKSVSFEKLVKSVALGVRSEKTLTTLAGRLARLDRELGEKDRSDLKKAAGERPMKQIMNDLLDAVDPDKHQAKAREIFRTETPSAEQLKSAAKELAKAACLPFDNPKFRNALIDIKKRNEQIIDELSKDKVLFAGGDATATERAHRITDSFRNFIEENKDELTALQIIYGKPYAKRRLTYQEIKQLAEAIEKPPYHLTPDLVWRAYEYLEKSKVKGAGPQKLLTNIISLVRFALGESPILEPFTQTVDGRFAAWLAVQEQTGHKFTPEQVEWLEMLKEHIATSLRIDVNDLELAPFYERGGPVKAYRLFGPGLNGMLEELNEALAG